MKRNPFDDEWQRRRHHDRRSHHQTRHHQPRWDREPLFPDAPGSYEDWTTPVRSRKRGWLGWFLAGLMALMLAWEAVQPRTDIYDGRFFLRVDGETAYAYGTTDSSSYPEVAETLYANPQLERVILAYVPGTKDMAENVRIARLFRDSGLDTHLTSTSYIASGGVHLFVAGEERTMECGAKIGVHSWKSSDGDTPRSLGYDPAEGYMSAFHEDMGVGADFYAFSRDMAPHESLYILRPGDIDYYGLLTDGECERRGWFG